MLCARATEEDCCGFCRGEVGRSTKTAKTLEFLFHPFLLPSISCELVHKLRCPKQPSAVELFALQNVCQGQSVVPARCGKRFKRIILCKIGKILNDMEVICYNQQVF